MSLVLIERFCASTHVAKEVVEEPPRYKESPYTIAVSAMTLGRNGLLNTTHDLNVFNRTAAPKTNDAKSRKYTQ